MGKMIYLIILLLFSSSQGSSTSFDGFQHLRDTWCRSGSARLLSGIEGDAAKCAELCRQANTQKLQCQGFNVRKIDGICALFSVGCIESRNQEWSFHRVSSDSSTRRTTRTFYTTTRKLFTTTTAVDTSTSVSKPPGDGTALRDFVRHGNTLCVGRQTMVRFSVGLANCAQRCTSFDWCAGFSTNDKDDSCVLRNGGCTLDPTFPGYDWYQKKDGGEVDPPSTTPWSDGHAGLVLSGRMAGYTQYDGTLCIGAHTTEKLAKGELLCAQRCSSFSWCIGFSLNDQDDSCVLRDGDCQLNHRHFGYKWYQRTAFEPAPDISTTTSEPSVDTPRTPGNYIRHGGKRCAGGSSVGNVESDLAMCTSACDADSNCYGINFRPGLTLCVARNFNCSQVDDTLSVFYEKPASRPTRPTTTPRPDSDDGLDGYIRHDDSLCVGQIDMVSYSKGLSSCAKKCSSLSWCYGFSASSDNSCVLRNNDCDLQSFPGYTWYQRIAGEGVSVNSSATRPPHTTAWPRPTTTDEHFGHVDLPGYTHHDKSQCIGGHRNTRFGSGLESCAERCLSFSWCFGFSINLVDNLCVMRDSGCEIRSGYSSYRWYHRIDSNPVIATTPRPTHHHITTQPPPPPPPTRPSGSKPVNYIHHDNSLCVGKMKEVEYGKGVDSCARKCSSLSWCFGFSLNEGDNSCVLRDSDCELESGFNGYVWYQKQSGSDSVVETTPARQTTTNEHFGHVDLPGYTHHDESLCIGEYRNIQYGSSLEACAEKCPSFSWCFGFSINLADNSCTMRDSGCEVRDGYTSFRWYHRIGTNPAVVTTPRSTHRQPTTLSTVGTTLKNPAENNDLLSNYVERTGKRCVGGTRVGQVENSLEKCVAACDADSNCYGINFRPETSTCVARTRSCQEIADTKATVYRKTGSKGDIGRTTHIHRPRTTPTSTVTRQTPEPIRPSEESKLADYIHYESSLCIGRMDRLEYGKGVDSCVRKCSSLSWCFGFSVNKADDSCVLRNKDCNIESGYSGYSWYHKRDISGSLPAEPPTTTTQAHLVTGVRLTGNMAGFTQFDNALCVGPHRTVHYSNGLTSCLQKCSLFSWCFGFSFTDHDLSCVLRDSGCDLQQRLSMGYKWFQKNSDHRPLPTTLPTPQPTTPRPTTTKQPVGGEVDGFVRYDDSLCVGAHGMVQYSKGIDSCAKRCSSISWCYGFSMSNQDDSCVMRNNDCNVQSFSGYTWYHRIGGAVDVVTTPEPLVIVNGIPYVDPSLYIMKNETRCAEGTSRLLGFGNVNNCQNACNFNPNCYGFYMTRNDHKCVAVTFGCITTRNASVVTFQKIPREEITTKSPPTTPLQISVGVHQRYDVEYDKNCHGSSDTQIGLRLSNINDCGYVCYNRIDCFGFNWLPDSNECVVRTTDCTMRDQNGAIAFVKKHREITTEEPRDDERIDYTKHDGKRCAGGSRVGNVENELEQCIRACDADASCYGINFRPNLQSCVARTHGCDQVDDSLSVFYEKPISRTSRPTTTPRSSGDDFQDFVRHGNTLCVGRQTMVRFSVGLANCAQRCTSFDWCAGFSTNDKDDSCVLRNGGCTLDPTFPGYDWYQKKDGGEVDPPSTTPWSDGHAGLVLSGRMAGYTQYDGTLCIGAHTTEKLAKGELLCAQRCSSFSWCIGFSLNDQDDSCVLRDGDCQLNHRHFGYKWYQRTAFEPAPDISTTTSEPSVDTPRTPGNYIRHGGKRCAGGSSVGNVESDLAMCTSACDADSNCYGINFRPGLTLCVARNFNCSQVDDTLSVFYEKPASRPTRPTTTPRPDSDDGLDGYFRHDDSLCVGQIDMVSYSKGLSSCAKKCSSLSWCYGFSASSDNSCVLRNNDCDLQSFPGYTWYQRIAGDGGSANSPSTRRPATRRTTTEEQFGHVRTTLKSQAGNEGMLSNYEERVGKRCAGGSKVGDVENVLAKCIAVCDADNSCYGINYRPAAPACVARTRGCQEVADAGSTVYRKTGAKMIGISQTTPMTIESALFPGYEIVIERMCLQSEPVDSSLTSNDISECASICNQHDDCHGFNWWQVQNNCVVQRRHCTEIDNDDAEVFFYRKLTSAALATTPANPQTPPRSTIPDIAQYTAKVGFRCMGIPSTQIGSLLYRATECARMCSVRSDCFGFDWRQFNGICLLQSTSCSITPTSGYVFYEKTAESVDYHQPIPDATTPRSSGGDSRADIQGFSTAPNTRCVGGSSYQVGDVETDYITCAHVCSSKPTCAGFNYRRFDGFCAMRSIGCVTENSGMYDYYRKADGTELPSSEDRYDLKTSKRCAGGRSASLGLYYGLENCKTRCDSLPSCFGFNYIATRESCALRTNGCIYDDTAVTNFYEKRQQPT